LFFCVFVKQKGGREKRCLFLFFFVVGGGGGDHQGKAGMIVEISSSFRHTFVP